MNVALEKVLLGAVRLEMDLVSLMPSSPIDAVNLPSGSMIIIKNY